MQTIQETIKQLHGSLQDYIEATYHISAPSLIEQRKELLAQDGVIFRIPYLESTPKYVAGSSFDTMAGLPPAALELFQSLSEPSKDLPRLIYDPPYRHQAESLQHNLVSDENLVIMTGTGSGKTESFLLPILGKLAREAHAKPTGFAEQPAMRALILYPMNALVNDQLGRLRAMFGDPRLVELFKGWCGRPPRFARYTSRTPYAGLRTSKKDSHRLQSFDSFYLDVLRRTQSDDLHEQVDAQNLLDALKAKGKWPAKPDLEAWFGAKGSSWQDRRTGEFVRAVTLPDDSELLTRHEIQAAPPDLLVTNYSMLEYMLMRPIERPIFDRTKEWLAKNSDETFLIVLDEAHLYRGAAGAEVGLLLRRLRDRLDIPPERFSVICATASFNDPKYAPEFGAQLSGLPASSFKAIQGTLDLKAREVAGSTDDAELLASIDLATFYAADSDEDKITVLQPLLDYLNVTNQTKPEAALYHALGQFGPMSMLVNTTMKQATPVGELAALIFPDAPTDVGDAAVTALMALGSIARMEPNTPGLLPCRIHNFFRGLPGLWVCMDPDCSELPADQRDGICGRMYSQPLSECRCGARVLELYTCRNCGTAYARAYTDDVDTPHALWAEPGQSLRMANGELGQLLPLDLLLEQPALEEKAEPADYDLETGQLNPPIVGPRMRTVFIRHDRLKDTAQDDEEADTDFETRGEFKPCAVCDKTARFGRSYVQDHQTKGDQPFQALIARQIQIQPPGPQKATRFAPLRGRKVLAFSDSRQVAARLAPNLQMYSERDSLRPLIISGFKWLKEQDTLRQFLNLDDLYFGVLLASRRLNVRLRPEMRGHENFEAEDIVAEAADSSDLSDPATLMALMLEIRAHHPPEALLSSMLTTLTDKFWGMEALALATLMEAERHKSKILSLPQISGVAETDDEKLALARYWLSCWNNNGFRLAQMPGNWINRSRTEGFRVRPRNPQTKFDAINAVIVDKASRKLFWDSWSPELLRLFTQPVESGHRCLNGSELSLQFGGDWVHCSRCKSVYRPIPWVSRCLNCESAEVTPLDPDSDPVFLARKGFYRKPVTEALCEPPREPMALIAAEHTAQLNAPQNEDVFSKAEENELFFQDIQLFGAKRDRRSTSIDILSSTTTMEVGIDLGALSGVALRNMPPGRANYQQRAGRAGRRGNAVATVIAFGSADSHDEHYFSEPDGMIRGDVVDPKLTLDNREIVCRHILAFLLQRYHQDRLPEIDPDQPHDLFSVLGSVAAFRRSESLLNRDDFVAWLNAKEVELVDRVDAWIPTDLSDRDRASLLENLVVDAVRAIDEAIALRPDEVVEESEADAGEEDAECAEIEVEAEEGEEQPLQASNSEKLLDRLLYCGKLPRYAFPTDVATFHIFDQDKSSKYRHIFRFAPSQGLPIALSQYAPGKQVWVSGKCYTSGAIYSVMGEDRYHAWESKRLYMECSVCGYARTLGLHEATRGETRDCEACGGEDSYGPARYWMRPPGFAHPIDVEEETSPDDVPESSYATRAKLTIGTPSEADNWHEVNDRLRGLPSRQHLLVSNTGPKKDGYNYCTKCGRIEAASASTSTLAAPHPKPYPDDEDKRICDGTGVSRHLVLGTDFITDISLFSMRVVSPMRLRPGHHSTAVALRTVSEALAKAACQLLEIEPGELMAEFRPALTPDGSSGLEAEIFLYDTLPGGAGFASQFAARGGELFERALHLMQSCPEDCDSSCYRCLRSFKNRFEHSLLDRHVGIQLIEYLFSGQQPGFSEKRLDASSTLLLNDLLRRNEGKVTFQSNAQVTFGDKSINVPILAERNGKKFVIALSGPLTSGYASDPLIEQLRESASDLTVIIENELVVRANLPNATRNVYQQLSA
ncbi:DEAD/DEAH box helicase [Qipengyuania mesophila]|uniref:DEAD/DEAH box helicase n=1 Tax=Qipengyuania mesophila TaxID=2867246 RepID=UPI003517FDAF